MARKSYSLKPIKSKQRVWLIVLFILFILGFLLRFDAVATPVGNALNVSPMTVKLWAGHIMMIVVSVLFGLLALSIASIPILGPLAVIAAMAVIGYEIWTLWNDSRGGGPG